MFTWEIFNVKSWCLTSSEKRKLHAFENIGCTDDIRKQLGLLHDQEPGRSQRSLIIVGLVNYVMGRAN